MNTNTLEENLDEILVRTGIVTIEQMHDAVQTAHNEDKPVELVLLETGLITHRDLVMALSIQLKTPLIDLKRHKVYPEAKKLVSEQLIRKHNVLPLDIINGSLAVVMENTMDVGAIDDIAAVSKMRVEPMMAFPEDISKAIDSNYRTEAEVRN